MRTVASFKNEQQKIWFIRTVAFAITALCVVNLHDVGDPRPLHISIPRGIINSMVLNMGLWLTSFKLARAKLRAPLSVLLFVSSFGVFIATPFSRVIAIIFVLFYFWVIYDLFLTGRRP